MHERGSSRDLVNDINAVESELKRRFPDVRWSFFEPELPGTGRDDQDYGATEPRTV